MPSPEHPLLSAPAPPQVVLGVLGCPNLPLQPIGESDCEEGQAGRALSEEGVGAIFAAVRGGGARMGPLLAPGLPSTAIHVDDDVPAAEASRGGR